MQAQSGTSILLLATLGLLVTSLQFSMVSVALPTIVADFGVTLAAAGWIVTSYLLAQAVSMPISGKLSDSLGRREVFIGGAVLFSLASLACALAPNIYVLVAARAGQGLSGGSMLPSAYGLVADAFPGKAERPLGLIAATFPLGSIVAPTVGGIIIEHLGWRWTFALNALPNVVIVVLAMLMLPVSRRTSGWNSIDIVGATLLASIVTATIVGLTELARDDPDLPTAGSALIIGGALVPVFLWQESRVADPLVDLSLVRRGPLALMNVLHFCYGIGLLGAFFFIPLYAQTAYDAGSSVSGLLLAPRSLVMMASSVLAAVALPFTGYRTPIVVGLLILSASLGAMSLGLHGVHVAGVAMPDLGYLMLVVMIGGLGIGIASPAANNAALGTAPHHLATVIGLRGMFRFVGGVFGTTLIVLITSRGDTTASGLEVAFGVVAIITALTTLLVIPLKGRRSRGAVEGAGEDALSTGSSATVVAR